MGGERRETRGERRETRDRSGDNKGPRGATRGVRQEGKSKSARRGLPVIRKGKEGKGGRLDDGVKNGGERGRDKTADGARETGREKRKWREGGGGGGGVCVYGAPSRSTATVE